MTRVLIYFTNFGDSLGGSEYLPLLFIAELQKSCDVTLALNWSSDIKRIAQLAGVSIDISSLKVVYVKPQNRLLQRLDAIIPFYRTWRLKRLAKNADICISTVNMFDFGKPAHHFIYLMRHFGDNAFYDYFMHSKPLSGVSLYRRKLRTCLAEKLLRPLLGVRSTRKILADPREHIYPNSHYVEDTMRRFYGSFNGKVFYPPTTFNFNTRKDIARNPMYVVCIGRIIPEKRVTDIIAIVERTRSVSGCDVKLRIAGQLTPQSSYTATIEKSASERNWVELVGALYGDQKENFLLSGTYAVHTRRDEEFGIAVAEYLKAGLIPIVPDEGGSREVVDSPDLTYHTNEDAARLLSKLLSDAAFRERQRIHCFERAKMFSSDAYMERQHMLIDEILQS